MIDNCQVTGTLYDTSAVSFIKYQHCI